MKTLITIFAFSCLSLATTAEAQVVVRPGPAGVYGQGYALPVTRTTRYAPVRVVATPADRRPTLAPGGPQADLQPIPAPCCQPTVTRTVPVPPPPAHVQARRTTVYRPLVPLAPAPRQVIVGRGILGQTKAYVPGQPVRNFFRYLLP